ncbi:MAG: hypothetical protein R2911_35035 [Caldilineaceae bacterium]
MGIKIKPFDVAEHLETDDDIWEFLRRYLLLVLLLIYLCLNTAARAKGMTEAKQAGVTRFSLYNHCQPIATLALKPSAKSLKRWGGICPLLVNKSASYIAGENSPMPTPPKQLPTAPGNPPSPPT